MKLAEETKKILENYSTINNTIFIPATKAGEETSLIQIADPLKNVIAQSKVPNIFANDVCISDLRAFLSTISSLKDPDIEFNPNQINIKDTTFSVKITYGNPETAIVFSKHIQLTNSKYTFTIKQADMKQLLNLSNILSLPDLRIFGENGKIYLQILNRQNKQTSNVSTLEVGEGNIPAGEEYFLQREKMKMLEGDYQVDVIIHDKLKTSLFKSLSHTNLEYIIALAV